MNTTDTKNSLDRDVQNHISSDRNLGKDLKDDIRKPDNDSAEIAERGYTVRNGHNPDGPNPDENLSDYDLDDLNDDFHTDRDLESNNEPIFEVELEDDDFEEENDELDNPSDAGEDDYDFNETEEEALEELDEDEDDEDDFVEEGIEEDENDYIEDDVQENNDEEEYPENDPRKF